MKPLIQSKQSGFSLTELLVVVALMTFLAAASIPALTSVSASGKVNQTVSEMAGLLEQSRQYAIAQNTYVWVAFYEDTNAAGGNAVTVAVMASKDGTDPTSTTPTYNFGTVPSTTALVNLICPLRTFGQVKLQDAGTLSFTNLPAMTLDATRNGLAKNAATFSIKPVGFTTAVSFARYIQFTPTGEARNSSSPTDVLEIGMQPRKGSGNPAVGTQTEKNVAVLRVSGLTGLTQVYRP